MSIASFYVDDERMKSQSQTRNDKYKMRDKMMQYTMWINSASYQHWPLSCLTLVSTLSFLSSCRTGREGGGGFHLRSITFDPDILEH